MEMLVINNMQLIGRKINFHFSNNITLASFNLKFMIHAKHSNAWNKSITYKITALNFNQIQFGAIIIN